MRKTLFVCSLGVLSTQAFAQSNQGGGGGGTHQTPFIVQRAKEYNAFMKSQAEYRQQLMTNMNSLNPEQRKAARVQFEIDQQRRRDEFQTNRDSDRQAHIDARRPADLSSLNNLNGSNGSSLSNEMSANPPAGPLAPGGNGNPPPPAFDE